MRSEAHIVPIVVKEASAFVFIIVQQLQLTVNVQPYVIFLCNTRITYFCFRAQDLVNSSLWTMGTSLFIKTTKRTDNLCSLLLAPGYAVWSVGYLSQSFIIIIIIIITIMLYVLYNSTLLPKSFIFRFFFRDVIIFNLFVYSSCMVVECLVCVCVCVCVRAHTGLCFLFRRS
jgi:hypothetical protein